MTIQEQNIKLLKSQVMDDVPEGGGAPTSGVIVDSASNAVFNDISELDRAGGRANLRKAFVSVQTPDRDSYFGANVIVAEPPADPLVSVTLFATSDVFDTRADAQNRIESYLAQGPIYSGYLFSDHIAGQAAVTLLQRVEVPLPATGDTFVLRKNEGLTTEAEQFVRVTKVVSRPRLFSDGASNVEFLRNEVTLTISDVLRYDFNGLDAIRNDASIVFTGRTKVYSTVVADAARYYGCVPLTSASSIGDFVAEGKSIFTQLVPSTKVEVPIADARMNQQKATLVPAGSTAIQNINTAFSSTQAIYVGGGILPGTLTIARGGITLTDKGGVLLNGSTSVGTVDYANGILRLSTSVFGTGTGVHLVTYDPASSPKLVTKSVGIPVTAQAQRLTWVASLDPSPAKGSLQASFRSQARWYTLEDDGSGALRGTNSSFGAGTVNFQTGTVSLTLGAMPDVGSELILTWVPKESVQPIKDAPKPSVLPYDALSFSLEVGKPIRPTSLIIRWTDRGIVKQCTDLKGGLTGYFREQGSSIDVPVATGRVDYATGSILLVPTELPAKGTVFTLTIGGEIVVVDVVVNTEPQTKVLRHAQERLTFDFTDAGDHWAFTLPGYLEAGTIRLSILQEFDKRVFPGDIIRVCKSTRVGDDSLGLLTTNDMDTWGGQTKYNIGTIDYSTGACTLQKQVANVEVAMDTYGPLKVLEGQVGVGGVNAIVTINTVTGHEVLPQTVTVVASTSLPLVAPTWSWWVGNQNHSVMASLYYVTTTTTPGTSTTNQVSTSTPVVATLSFDTLFLEADVLDEFQIGGHRISTDLLSGDYQIDPSPITGNGIKVGTYGVRNSISYPAKGIVLTDWPAAALPKATGFIGSTLPVLLGINSTSLTDSVTFRTSISPLFSGGFTIAGNFQNATSFTATANAQGFVISGSAVVGETAGTFGVFGKVDYESGVVKLFFGRRVPVSAATNTGVLDLSYLGITGVQYVQSYGVQADSLRYNAVGYSYIPLDATILGLDPVRLPADGKVPIFRSGSFAVIGHAATSAPQTVATGDVLSLGRTRISRVRVKGANGTIHSTGYVTDLDAGTITFTSVAGYSQPITIENRIEDLLLVSDAQINGLLTFTSPMTHNFPLGSYISSALIIGDMHSRVSLTFDQTTWANAFADAVNGTSAAGTYNTVLAPIEVTNTGALTERWAIQFTNTTSFNVIGEHVGVIAVGNTSVDCSPTNPATGAPYFTIRAIGWGSGWAAGNALRFNTIGALYPIWIVRTILQGPATSINDAFTVIVRGDVDRP